MSNLHQEKNEIRIDIFEYENKNATNTHDFSAYYQCLPLPSLTPSPSTTTVVISDIKESLYTNLSSIWTR